MARSSCGREIRGGVTLQTRGLRAIHPLAQGKLLREINIAEPIPNRKSGETSSARYSPLGLPEPGSALERVPRLTWLHQRALVVR